jgi:hypothetical protein
MTNKIEGMIYVAVRVKDLETPKAVSASDKCSNCGERVWIHIKMAAMAKQAAAIMCAPCVSEARNQTTAEIAQDNLGHTIKALLEEGNK